MSNSEIMIIQSGKQIKACITLRCSKEPETVMHLCVCLCFSHMAGERVESREKEKKKKKDSFSPVLSGFVKAS